MPLPPKDVAPSALFAKLLETPEPSEVIDFPRPGPDGSPLFRVRVRVLRVNEIDQARRKAHERCKALGVAPAEMDTPINREILGDAVAREVVAMACSEAEPVKGTEGNHRPTYARLFADGAAVSELTPDELAALFGAYQLVQHRFGPFEHNLHSAEEVDAWVDALTAGARELPLFRLSSHQRDLLCVELAHLVRAFRSSTDSQPESLPESSESSRSDSPTDTSSASEQPVEPTPLADRERVTLADATKLAQRLRGD